MNFQMFKLVLEKAEEPEEPNCQHPLNHGKSKRVPEKHLFLLYDKAFDCVDHNKLENSERWEYQTTWPASWEICMQVTKQQLELDMEKQTGPK